MEAWKEDFIAGLAAGKPPAYLARMCAGLPLANVHAARKEDPDFDRAWEAVAPGGVAARVLTPEALEAILWAQCSDEQAAAYFNLSEADFAAAVAGSEDLSRVHSLARNGGRAALQRAQFEAAMDGDKSLLVWLGKQHLGQADKVEGSLEVRRTDDVDDLAKRLLLILAKGGQIEAIGSPPPIDVACEEIADGP